MRWLLPIVCLWITPAMAEISTDGEAPDTKIVIQQLKRDGNAVTLRFTVVNDSSQGISTGGFMNVRESFTVDGVYLVDIAGKKKYEVIRDSEGHCICTQHLTTIQPKTSVNVWAKFPSPPDSVQKIGVSVPHFMPLDNVPITE